MIVESIKAGNNYVAYTAPSGKDAYNDAREAIWNNKPLKVVAFYIQLASAPDHS